MNIHVIYCQIVIYDVLILLHLCDNFKKNNVIEILKNRFSSNSTVQIICLDLISLFIYNVH